MKSFYRYRERKVSTTGNNPWHTILKELRTPDKTMPHQTAVWRVWMRTHTDLINAEYDVREVTASKTGIALRSQIAKELFEGLSAEEQEDWKDQANKAYLEECDKYKARLSGDPSNDPAEQME